jgi:hypothetical protein
MATDYFLQRSRDQVQARMAMEDLVDHLEPDQIQAMYQVAWGLVRDDIACVVKARIEIGHTALAAKFPQLASVPQATQGQEHHP